MRWLLACLLLLAVAVTAPAATSGHGLTLGSHEMPSKTSWPELVSALRGGGASQGTGGELWLAAGTTLTGH